MTLVNARAAFETAIKTAVVAADNTVTVVLIICHSQLQEKQRSM